MLSAFSIPNLFISFTNCFDPNFEKYANKAKTAYVKSVQDDWNSSEYCEDYDSPADAWDDAWGQSEADMGYVVKVDNEEIEL